MTTQEKIKTLEKVLDNVHEIDSSSQFYGLCGLIKHMSFKNTITDLGFSFIYDLILLHAQDKKICLASEYLFTPGQSEPRRQWLQEQIQKLKNQ